MFGDGGDGEGGEDSSGSLSSFFEAGSFSCLLGKAVLDSKVGK